MERLHLLTVSGVAGFTLIKYNRLCWFEWGKLSNLPIDYH